MLKTDVKMKDVVICNPPIETERLQFLFSHLDCDCIADTSDEMTTDRISVLAYATNQSANARLRKFFYANSYDKRYKLLVGIDRREVNSIG